MTASEYSHLVLVTGARSWTDLRLTRDSFNDLWNRWGPANITRPLLVSGHCPEGADALAEQLWHAADFEVLPVSADWSTHGRRAGFLRNQRMVDLGAALSERGSVVRCAAFLDLCRRPDCPQRHDEQLMPNMPGHLSHGTVHCRGRALVAGLNIVDVVHPSLPPF